MNVLDLNAMHGKEIMLDIICGGVKRETSSYNKFSYVISKMLKQTSHGISIIRNHTNSHL